MDSAVNYHTFKKIENDEGSYTPLLFYMDSPLNYHGPILKGNNSSSSSESNMVSKNNNSTPLSLYTTILVSRPAPPGPMGESQMDIFVENEVEFHIRHHPLSFYMNPTHRGRLRMTYIPLSSIASSSTAAVSNSSSSSQSKVTAAVSNSSSSSQSKVSFPCFAASQSKSVPNIVFGSFGSQSSASKSLARVSRNYIPLSIPDKVAFSILSKLPIKSLKRFGCARKSWSILFQNTDFMTMYSKRFISPHGSDDDDYYHTFILANHDDGRLYHSEFHLLEKNIKLNLPSPLQPSRDGTYILGSTSVNGIFCLGQNFTPIQKSLYVMWNPLTQEFMVVPPSPAELVPKPKPPEEGFMEHSFHGFGYDKLRDDFKVVQLISFSNSFNRPTTFFEIYSLKSNSWRLIHMEKDLCCCEHGFSTAGAFKSLEVYLDGVCHWLVLRSSINRKKAMSLLSFDLSDEVFFTTPIGLEQFSPYTAYQRLTVLNGSIAFISNYHDDIVFHISILGELGVSESWIKLYIYGPLPSVQWPPIGFGKMGYIFITKKDYEVAYVDLSTQIIEEVGITCGVTSELIGGLYKESLLSIGVSSN